MQLSRSQIQSMRQTVSFTSAQLSDMASMYASGKSLRAIAGIFGISRMGVRSRLIDMSVPMRDFRRMPMLTDEQCSEILFQYASGVSVSKLSIQFNCHEKTISQALERAKLN